ncbi:hypothetical protein FOZ63_032891 [Perkinsus olseni]|uniref:Uncharacterized protein n=1 Tax=Perkinsus olseni TaxID=32597 RepID=A0A7J6RKQ8_PEROL|nr:hypothetical protein FOZ63_032891 [Perkinsus olseni]
MPTEYQHLRRGGTSNSAEVHQLHSGYSALSDPARVNAGQVRNADVTVKSVNLEFIREEKPGWCRYSQPMVSHAEIVATGFGRSENSPTSLLQVMVEESSHEPLKDLGGTLECQSGPASGQARSSDTLKMPCL